MTNYPLQTRVSHLPPSKNSMLYWKERQRQIIARHKVSILYTFTLLPYKHHIHAHTYTHVRAHTHMHLYTRTHNNSCCVLLLVLIANSVHSRTDWGDKPLGISVREFLDWVEEGRLGIHVGSIIAWAGVMEPE